MITASEVMVTSMDQQFLERLQKIVEENMEEETFQVEDIGRQIGLSRSQLQRKLSALLDCSPAAYLRRVRLERAKQLLEKNAGTVSEICFQVGYGNVSAFARAFRETFGKSPSAVRARNPN
jgi:transcriptional regulator GlxA family with amidase domain